MGFGLFTGCLPPTMNQGEYEAKWVAMPEFNVVSGTYRYDTAVVISTPTAGASIHYTTDGSAPTQASATYSGPVVVSGSGTSKTIRVVATKSGLFDSPEALVSLTVDAAASVLARWAQVPGAPSYTYPAYQCIVGNSDGSMVAGGSVNMSYYQTITFGEGISVGDGVHNSYTFLVKYDRMGKALWVTTFPGSLPQDDYSLRFQGLARGAGGTVVFTARNSKGSNYVGKADGRGKLLWMKEFKQPGNSLSFNAVTTDSADNSYVVGSLSGTGTYIFDAQSIHGLYNGGNLLVLKFSSLGTVLWAKTVSGSSSATSTGLTAVAVDNAGAALYAVGNFGGGTGSFGLDAASPLTVPVNDALGGGLVIRFDFDGLAQWGRTTTGSYYSAAFLSVAAGNSRVFVGGHVSGSSSPVMNLGSVAVNLTSYDSAVIVGLDSSGTGQWGQSWTTSSSFNPAVSVDGHGNALALAPDKMVQYTVAGVSTTIVTSPPYFLFDGMATDPGNGIAVLAHLGATSPISLGNGITVQGKSSPAPLVVKYE